MKRSPLRRKARLKPGRAVRPKQDKPEDGLSVSHPNRARRKPPKVKRKDSRRAQRKRCIELWSKIIRARENGCAVCGRPRTQAHHLIGKRVDYYCADLNNGIALCYTHHMTDTKCSAHSGILGFRDWMMEHRPEQFDWWDAHRYQLHTGEPVDFDQIEADLRKIWETFDEQA